MFRRGGSTNTGIMSGLVDRKNYKFGSMTEDQIRSNIDMLVGLQDQFAPLPKTRLPLGEVGLALASGAPLVDALGAGYKKFVSEDDKRRALAAKREQAAVSTVLGQAMKEKKTQTPTLKQVRNTSNQELYGVKPGETGFVTAAQILSAPGVFAPIDNRMAFTFDTDTKVLSQVPISERDRILDNKAKATAVVSSVNTLKELKNNMLTRLDDTPTGAVAAVYGVIEGTSDQFSQASDALGFTNQNLKFDRSNSEKLDAYLESKGITKGAANFAAMKSSVINLAYILAKIKEPLNPRLSEGDIIRQMNRINFGASKDVFAKSLNQIFEDELISARGQIRGYDLNPDDFFGTGEEKKSTSGATDTKKDNDPLNIR
jgi:hypothetical protein